MDRADLKTALLTVEQMYQADAFAIDHGTSGEVLMEAAGQGAARAVIARYRSQATLVLCGPGNNGGDGFVIARVLAGAGWPVRLAMLGDPGALKGDAATMRDRWDGEIETATAAAMGDASLIVDALFGAGLSRPLDGEAAALATASAGRTVVAVDVPSGINGNTGGHAGAVFQADLTVTFFTPKPGHLLMPGRELCGELTVIDIGIPPAALDSIGPDTWRNIPERWRPHLNLPGCAGHKYSRGHAIVAGGGVAASGAARLAAMAALRAGAGLVTCAVPPGALTTYAAHVTAIMLTSVADEQAWTAALADPRRNAVLVGPGHGLDERTRHFTSSALGAGKAVVLDADALSVFKDDPDSLFSAIRTPCILTPHEGEFRRLFQRTDDKLADARAAAARSGAVVILKGPDTVVAAPDGRAVINDNAPPWLATAGSGDVLAGLAVGLLAQDVPAFEAAAMAVWMHGRAGALAGIGLIAEDLAPQMPLVLKELSVAV